MSNLNLNTISSLDTGREVDVNRVMQTVDYVGGLVIDSLDTVIVDGDDRYVLAASAATPYTTTGAGMPEGGAFVSVGDAVLRQDLAAPGGAGLVGNGGIVFDSVADMKAATWLTVGQKVRTLGYYTSGDGGGNDYEIVAAGTGTGDGGSFIDLFGSGLQANGLFVTGAVNVKQYGAVGDGATDDSAAIVSAFEAAMATAKPVMFGSGTFLVNQISLTLTADLVIDLAGGTIKGSDATGYTDTSMMILDADYTQRYAVELRGPGTVDGSLRTNTPDIASGSGVEIKYSDDVAVDGVRFTAGTSRTDGYGDAGLVPLSCKRVVVSGCFFEGWDDHPIYCTGGARASAHKTSEVLIVSGCTFANTGGVRIAREHSYVNISDNSFIDCYAGIVSAGGDSNWKTGRTFIISNNLMVGFEAAAIDLRYQPPGCSNVVANNIIHDWAKSVGAPAINLRGIAGTVVSGNTVRPLHSLIGDSSTVCQEGIYLQTSAGDGDDSAIYEAKNNLILGNIIEVFERGGSNNYAVRDLSDSQTNIIGANHYLNAAAYRVYVSDNGSNGTVGSEQLTTVTATGTGMGTADPKSLLELVGTLTLTRKDTPDTQYLQAFSGGSSHLLKGYSTVNNAKKIQIHATTDNSNTPPTGGELGIEFMVRGGYALTINEDRTVRLLNVPSSSSGLASGSLYQDSSGFIKIVP